MPKISAGLLMCRMRDGAPELFLVHPGGPFFARRDDGAWTLPKGLVEEGEDDLAAARREFAEETGFSCAEQAARFEPLGEVTQRAGKIVRAWAFAGDCDPTALRSNTFELEWPPRSGHRRPYPEADRGAFFDPEAALRKVLTAQQPLLRRALSPEILAALFGHR